MAKFACQSTLSQEQLPICKYPSANAFADGDEHSVAQPIHSAKPHFRQKRGIGGIVHLYWQSGSAFNCFLDIEHWPFQVRSKYQLLRIWIDAARQAQAYPLERPL